MSHPSSKGSSWTSIPSTRSQPHVHTSPLNALSNPSGNPQTVATSNPLISNRIIPRDYLKSKSRLSPVQADPNPDPDESRVAPQTRTSPTNDPADVRPGQPNSAAVQTYQSHGEQVDPGRLAREEASDDPGLKIPRTRSPESIATTTSLDTIATSVRRPPGVTNMPRNSSIDSAISSVSASSAQRRDHGDTRDPSPETIRHLIATTGSVEALVLRLLKEKDNATSQNTQLWKLVEKQRALLFGLNKDLKRVTEDRDKYKRRLQSHGASSTGAAQSPVREVLDHGADSKINPASLPPHEQSVQTLAESSTANEPSSPIDGPEQPDLTSREPNLPGADASMLGRPVLQAQTSGLAKPTFALTEATPLTEKPNKGFSASRKIAPKPLTLLSNNNEPAASALVNAADRAMLASDDDDGPRGRRKTREEDDQDREKSLKKEQDARSKSKKSSAPPAESESETTGVSAPIQPAVSRSVPNPIPNIIAPTAQQGSSVLHERLLPMPLRSPGLPASPRPFNNSLPGFSAGLPMSPRAPPPGPLSPRAPKQAVPPPMMSPSPFVDPAVLQRQNAMARQAAQENHLQPADRLQVHEPTSTTEVPPVYQGLVSPQYPNLLLPPNALPSIQIQVASSRLRPSRHSMLGLRTQEDSTVFSLSIFSRASRNELWRIEKIPAALPQLEQQLRPRCKELPRIPDKKLFGGHSPAIVDARRQAIDEYFEDLLDMEMDEPSALIVCRFLSTDVLDPGNEPQKHLGVNQESLPQNTSLSGKVVKTGWLTKKGKNFGGWKSRYFVLDSSELKYYETPGGPQIGAIKISHAKIGRQKPEDSASTDPEDQYRHAFLIQEPKKKDSTAYVRHVLCAESDSDRDQWVTALLHYVEGDGQPDNESPSVSTNASFVSRPTTSSANQRTMETYSSSPSPTSPTSMTDTSISETMSKNAISGPMNGAPIHDSTQWGNRNPQPTKEKPSKMGSIFHFKKGSEEQLNQNKVQPPATKPRVLRHNGYVRAVFGLPLAEAVEYCTPFNVDVPLPAVVYRCIEYLRFRNAANEEGLFRIGGSNVVIKTLKDRFNTEGDVDLVDENDYLDIHAIASLFKTYLRELPSPLLTRDLHLEFMRVLDVNQDSQENKVAAFNVLVHRLPKVNFYLLRAMAEYLLEVTENSAKNKMTLRNVGIVFSPTVNIPMPVFQLFLSEFDAIFMHEPGETIQPQIKQTQLQAPANLNPADIRSPRHQMFSDIPTPAYNQTHFNHSDDTGVKGHQSSGSGEFGMAPLHPTYENGLYVSHPQDLRTQAYNPPSNQHNSQMEGEEQYGSLNRMLVPQGATTDKRRKRESAMLF